MDVDVLDLYGRASEWAVSMVAGASGQLDMATGCDGWDVRTLMNHMLETGNYFVGAAQGSGGSPPGEKPPELLGADPVTDFELLRTKTIDAFGEPGALDRTGPALGIAFSDQLLHGWDLATATGQDAVMPDELAEAAYGFIHGRFTDEQRKGIFKPEIKVEPDASPQDRLLAYTGREPKS